MKKFSLFAFAFVAALAMTSCSDDATGGIAETTSTGNSSTGNGYMAISINMPSTSSTRASVTGYDDGIDGTEGEYDIKDVTLYVFGGSSIDDATLQAVYDLTPNFEKYGTDTDQITSTQTITFETTSMQGDYYYPVVILNHNDQMPSMTTNYSTLADLNSGTGISTTADAMHATGFFMSNSPYANVAGGTYEPGSSVTITSFPEFTSDNIYVTEEEAQGDPIVLYVERALSKVTMNTASAEITDANIASVAVDGWLLDNTNKYTYIVRNVACGTDDIPTWWNYKSTKETTPAPEYRFIDAEPMKVGGLDYRTYFGIDPNYNVAHDDANFNVDVTEESTYGSVDDPQYCLENTFNVPNQTEENTTRAVLKATLSVYDAGGAQITGSFYMLNNKEDYIYTETGIQDYIKAQVISYIESYLWSEYVEEGTLTADNITVSLTTTSSGSATYTISTDFSGITAYKTGYDMYAFRNALTAWETTFISNNTLTYYKDGAAYYRIKIKHFGDSDTPWESLDADKANSYPGTVDEYENKWLGRYGVLRNNWYEISVTGFNSIGSPTVPELNTDFDDTTDDYISVEINVLPWAKRSQSETL